MHRAFRQLLERNLDHAREFESRFESVQEFQHPDVVTICCADSRVLQDHMWSNDEPGHIFTCSNIGNRVIQRTQGEEVVSGDVLYPVRHAGTTTVVVVGHTGCGAITATYDALTGSASEPPGIEYCLELLGSHLEAGVERLPDGLDHAAAINRLVEYNVDRQVEFLEASEDVAEDIDIIGVVYDFQDIYSGSRGEINVINVGGENDAETLQEQHPEIAPRIERLWTY